MTPQSGHDYSLCGWRVASALPLPDLLPWTGDGRAAELTIDLGPVPQRLPELVVDRPLLQVSADGTCRFAIPGVAAYLVDPDGERVIIDTALPPDAPDIRVFLLGTVFAILCFRRGLLPLHASCVRIGDGAVALAGHSGAGKSTMAAAFLGRGHAVLADDVTVLDIAAPGGPRVLPAFPRLKLWRDVMKRMGLSANGLERTRAELNKFHLPIEDGFCGDELPLSAIFHIERVEDPRHAGTHRLSGAEGVAAVGRDLYRRSLMGRLGMARRLLPASIPIVGVPCGTWHLKHCHDLPGTNASMAAILERVRG